VDTSPRHAKTLRPAVGLDEPCQKCGRPIYYNYKGPVAGLCGRCTDGSKKAARGFRKSKRVGFFEGRRKRVSIVVAILLGLAVAAVLAGLLFGLV